MSDWEQELAGLGGAVRPTRPVAGGVEERVRRRVRRRRTGVVAGAGLAVAVVVSGIAVASGPDVRPPIATPTTTPSERPTASDPAEAFTCPGYEDVFGDDEPVIPDLREQQAVLALAKQRRDGFTVTYARPSPVGPLVLVDGDLDQARADLAELDIQHVWRDYGNGASIQWVTDQTLQALRREVRGRAGLGQFALRDEVGAIEMTWKAPVPPDISALAGPRPNGATVIVTEVRYSSRDIQRAQQRLQDFLDESGLRDQWTSSGGCHDNSGLRVGMLRSAAGRPGIAERIAAAVGMPVLVEAEEPPSIGLLPYGG